MATSTLTSIGSSNSTSSSLASSLAVTGLASGVNWSTIVSELANAERSPETQWQNQQSTLAAQNASYSTIKTDLTTLQNDAKQLLDPAFFNSVVASSSSPSVASASATSGATQGSFLFAIAQLATAAQLNGVSYVSQVLDPSGDPSQVTVGAAGFATPVTAGTFTVDGAQITIATTDSLKTVFDNIASQTGGKVSASYDAGADKITLTSSDGSPIVLGSATDSSNFLQVAQLYNNTGITSAAALGSLSTTAPVTTAGFSTPVTAGTFTVNGASITVAATDSLQQVFADIASATGNKVTAGYNSANQTITLSSSDGSPINLGSGSDTSNFLQSAQLFNNTGTITSASKLGRANTSASLKNADLNTPITDDGSGSGNGSFLINGVTINYNLNSDSLQDVLNNINNSTAGVSAAYNVVDNRFVLTNKNTGDVGISMKDVTGNFLGATGLSAGTLNHGKNLLYTLNGNTQQLVSQSNTIDSSSSGISGLSLTAQNTGATTVTVGADTNTISNAIQQFVTDYNSAQNFINSQQSVTTAADDTVTPGTLTGDTNTNDIVTSLRSLMTAVESITGTSGAVTQLGDLGFQSNGQNNTLASNASTLNRLLSSNLNDVKALFSDPTKGLAVQLNIYVTDTIGDSGTLTARQTDLTQESSTIGTQISNLETKISNDTAQWNSEFQAMETAEAQTNQELTYLSQGVSNGSL